MANAITLKTYLASLIECGTKYATENLKLADQTLFYVKILRSITEHISDCLESITITGKAIDPTQTLHNIIIPHAQELDSDAEDKYHKIHLVKPLFESGWYSYPIYVVTPEIVALSDLWWQEYMHGQGIAEFLEEAPTHNEDSELRQAYELFRVQSQYVHATIGKCDEAAICNKVEYYVFHNDYNTYHAGQTINCPHATAAKILDKIVDDLLDRFIWLAYCQAIDLRHCFFLYYDLLNEENITAAVTLQYPLKKRHSAKPISSSFSELARFTAQHIDDGDYDILEDGYLQKADRAIKKEKRAARKAAKKTTAVTPAQ